MRTGLISKALRVITAAAASSILLFACQTGVGERPNPIGGRHGIVFEDTPTGFRSGEWLAGRYRTIDLGGLARRLAFNRLQSHFVSLHPASGKSGRGPAYDSLILVSFVPPQIFVRCRTIRRQGYFGPHEDCSARAAGAITITARRGQALIYEGTAQGYGETFGDGTLFPHQFGPPAFVQDPEDAAAEAVRDMIDDAMGRHLPALTEAYRRGGVGAKALPSP